jgi:hypothetical protein
MVKLTTPYFSHAWSLCSLQHTMFPMQYARIPLKLTHCSPFSTTRMKFTESLRSCFAVWQGEQNVNVFESSSVSQFCPLLPSNIILDFKLSPCSECCTLSSGYFPGVWILYADVSEKLCLFHLHKRVGMKNSSYLPAYEDGTECSETSAYKIRTPGNYPEESIQHSEHSESLKSRKVTFTFTYFCYWISKQGIQFRPQCNVMTVTSFLWYNLDKD